MHLVWILLIIITGPAQKNGLEPIRDVKQVEFSDPRACQTAKEVIFQTHQFAGATLVCVQK